MASTVAELTVGDRHEAVVVRDLSRTQIVMYAGASGDFNPLHTDEVYATQVAGYDTVIAHGALTMGLSAKMITDWLVDAELLTYGLRFQRQVWPGDTLTTAATVSATEVRDGRVVAELQFETVNGNDEQVVSGYARVREVRPGG